MYHQLSYRLIYQGSPRKSRDFDFIYLLLAFISSLREGGKTSDFDKNTDLNIFPGIRLILDYAQSYIILI